MFSRAVPVPAGRSGRSLPALNPEVNLYPLLILLNDAVIFSQRMTLPAFRQQNALQVGMSLEADAKHVVNFTLQPVGSRPDRNCAGHRFAIGEHRLHANALVISEGRENPDHIKLISATGTMYRCDVHAVIEQLLVP